MELGVFTAINTIQKKLAEKGIDKAHYNDQQKYNFRGIDDVYNALANLLAENGLCIIPYVVNRTCEAKTTKTGGNLFFTTVEVEYTLISSRDGSQIKCKTFGEAMDSGDKSTNKAMSTAYKYMCFQVFCIPTEGDNDSDNNSYDLSAELPEALKNAILQANNQQALNGIYKREFNNLTTAQQAEFVELCKNRKQELANANS